MKTVTSPLMFLLAATTCAAVAPDNSCDDRQRRHTLFDVGLTRVFGMSSFRALRLEEVRQTFTKFFTFRVWLWDGKLQGLQNIRRLERNFMNVTDSGVVAHFEIHGGPLVVTYTGTLRSVLMDARVNVDIYVPQIYMSLYVEEPSPNDLRVTYFRFWAAPVNFTAHKIRGSTIVFDLFMSVARSSIEKAIDKEISAMMRQIVQKFVSKVKLFALDGTTLGGLPKQQPVPAYTSAISFPKPGASASSSDIPLGQWQDTSKWGIFDHIVKRIVLNSRLDPIVFNDVDDVALQGWNFLISNVTVEGLRHIRRGSDNYAAVKPCGIDARVALSFENVRVHIFASTQRPQVPLRVDATIQAVEVILQVKENNSTIEVEDYQLGFPVPLEYEVHVQGSILGRLFRLFNGHMRRLLTADEAKCLETVSKKYINKAIVEVTEFIKDPAPWMPWNNSIIEAYSRYRDQQKS
ncbi:uncharacterized protein [Dermacentor andersoni]|uniref:uncharacterized protein n=1 Tax=Dermacentor andersoni TaxID=34620 RepID=UPI002155638F|nr:uncharacterized protein LOC126540602 [Dermacentor andersoni]